MENNLVKIIGGKGFVGTRLKDLISEARVLDKRLNTAGYCDITKIDTLKVLLTSDTIILLAAEHRDDVSPISKYYETNVRGAQNVLDEMDRVGCST